MGCWLVGGCVVWAEVLKRTVEVYLSSNRGWLLGIILRKRFAKDMINGVLVVFDRLSSMVLNVFPSSWELIES